MMWTLCRASRHIRKHGMFIGLCRGLFPSPEAAVHRAADLNPDVVSEKDILKSEDLFFSRIADNFFVPFRGFCSYASESSGGRNDDSMAAIEEESDDGEEDKEQLELLTVNNKHRLVKQEIMNALVNTRGDITHILDKWLQEGVEFNVNQAVAIQIVLSKRRMHRMALQFLDWFEKNAKVDLTEGYYAGRLNVIAKVQSLAKAEEFIEQIPESMRGEVVYRTVLANCVHARNKQKAEAVFKKMMELGFPITIYSFNKMILIYKMLDMNKIANILQLMEKENVNPSSLTYRLLIDIKGNLCDTSGMEQLVDAMKDQGVEVDVETLYLLARHYGRLGLKDKIESILKEVDERNLKLNGSERRDHLLLLYGALGKTYEVESIWKYCKLNPTMRECHAAIEAWGRLGKVAEAESVFETMIQTWGNVSAIHYTALLDVYVNHKLLRKAVELVKRMGDSGCKIDRATWHALVRLHVEDGQLEKANLILERTSQLKQMVPLFKTLLIVMEQYAKQGDVRNTEKLFHMMKHCGYTGHNKPFEVLIQAYVNSKTLAYGFRERMKAENVFPNKIVSAQLQLIESFSKEECELLHC